MWWKIKIPRDYDRLSEKLNIKKQGDKMSTQQQNVNKLVGRDENGDYYWLDYVFKDEDFKGAVGTIFRPISESQREDVMSLDNARELFDDLWREAVASGTTDEGLDEFIENSIRWDGDEAFFDLSDYDNGCKVAEIYNSELPDNADESEKAEFSECRGGGRCFYPERKWVKIYDKAALKLALKYEKNN